MSDEMDETLRSLGIPADSARVLAMLPLVQVAWADGEVQVEEREAIVRIASERYGLDADGTLLLESWLTHAPTDPYVRRGRAALLALVREGRLGLQVENEELAAGVLDDAHTVAKAAGGWFGFRAVDGSEREALDALAEAFRNLHDPHATLPGDAVETWNSEEMTDPWVFKQSQADAAALGTSALPEGVEEPTVVVVGEGTQLPLGQGLTIGRHGSNDISLPIDARVSRNHAELVPEDGRWIVRDLGSANGTYVNGERIVARRLLGRELIRVGGTRLVVVGI